MWATPRGEGLTFGDSATVLEEVKSPPARCPALKIVRVERPWVLPAKRKQSQLKVVTGKKMVASWAAPLEKTVYGENSDKASSFF